MGGGFALAAASGRGFDVASANYGMLPANLDDDLRGACPIVASFGGRDRSLRGAADRLEASLERMRESNSALEERRADDEKKRRVLRARVARQEKGGAADMEYLRNVLLRWFTMAPEERASLFPVICAACAFTPTELAAINRAREAAAPSSSWLPWRSASSSAVNSRRAFDDGA